MSSTEPTFLVPGIDPCSTLEIPPPPVHPPLRARRVLQLLRELRTSHDQVEAGLELFDAVGGVGGERTFQRFVRMPEGQRMLRTRPDLVAQLGNRSALAKFPEGSLGRAYLDFANQNGFAADGLVEKNRDVRRYRPEDDPYRQWFWDRFTVAHDLWHVMTGCPTTPEGESKLLAFSFAQNPQRGYVLLLVLIAFGMGLDGSGHRGQWRAWRAGRRATALIGVPWEDFLARPLDEVRERFGVERLAS